jgi:hypothetical protein
VKALGGDGAFVRSSAIETMSDAEVRELFVRQIIEEYRGLDKAIAALEQKVQSIRKGTKLQDKAPLTDQLAKAAREFDEIRKRDFFFSTAGEAVNKRLQQLRSGLKGLDKAGSGEVATVSPKHAEKYRKRVWITRKKPFVDRMASAWLIKRFIDPDAVFKFIEERALSTSAPESVTFDLRNGEFTHVGDLCTFEALVKAFAIKDKAVKKIAEIVHDLDVKDEKYGNAETAGVEEILTGIRKSGKNDRDTLEKELPCSRCCTSRECNTSKAFSPGTEKEN